MVHDPWSMIHGLFYGTWVMDHGPLKFFLTVGDSAGDPQEPRHRHRRDHQRPGRPGRRLVEADCSARLEAR
jgi:hypothetical protein